MTRRGFLVERSLSHKSQAPSFSITGVALDSSAESPPGLLHLKLANERASSPTLSLDIQRHSMEPACVPARAAIAIA